MNTIQKIELETAKLLINGNFIESETQEWQDIVNPATQEVIGDLVKAVAAAALVPLAWKLLK